MKAMRQPTLETIGLGSVIDIFKAGKLPVSTDNLVDEIFGVPGKRGSLVVSGANGIVGAGKMMQLGSRLAPYGIPIIGLDFPSAPDGIGRQYSGLMASFGADKANAIMSGIIRMHYDGKKLPEKLKEFNPCFLLEAIPEILEIKKSHYEVFRKTFPGIEIRSVTSGFPSSELGVGIAHPAFPHEINKIWEIVEETPSAVTKLLWSLGLMPIPVSDHWSFVLDVLFCGLTLAATRYHHASNMPYWKIDKYVRRLIGPNPMRAHDAIGAKGANFLTWSCLHHLTQKYGSLFAPTDELEYRKDSGQNWYPLNHFRPLVNWKLEGKREEEFENWLLGPIIQMTSLLLKEKRAHLSHMNAIGELCAQFRSGVLAMIRNMGADKAIKQVESYHRLHPEAAECCWYPEVMDDLGSPHWRQLYVNAEHDGKVGVISIARESYNHDVDTEINRSIDWLKAEGIENVILSSDFHLSTQLVGADTAEFYPALSETGKGVEIASSWSRTARRLESEFKTSVGFINGKRCLGGMLELMLHCHYIVTIDDTQFGMPEVTLPVVPGMEGCHWPFRKAEASDWSKIMHMLLTGEFVRGRDAVGWLVDYSGSMEDALATAWNIASDGNHSIKRRELNSKALSGMPLEIPLPQNGNSPNAAAIKAIVDCISGSCSVPLPEALTMQAKHAGEFMGSKHCNRGVIGSEASKVLNV